MTTVRSEWGLQGVRRLRPEMAVLVIVDVLSFSTAVDIATGRGARVLPFPHGDHAAAQAAADAAGAVLAAPRAASGGQLSLSPASLARIAGGTLLMLPSPNGSRLTLEAGPGHVLAGCLLNATAVARAALALAGGGNVGVVPAGERWPDGSLRPAVEDLLGTGAIIAALARDMDAEARLACMAYQAAAGELDGMVRACVSGRELADSGFGDDVSLALELDVSAHAPLLVDGAYTRFLPP